MAPVSTPPAPGSMTVPPLFGWEAILTGLLLLLAVAVVALVVVAARAGASGRREWQAELDARSRRWDAVPERGADVPGPSASRVPFRMDDTSPRR